MSRIKMPSSGHYSKFIKWIIIPLACIVVLLFIGSHLLSRYASKQLEARLKSTYSTFGSLYVNLFNQRITITEFEANPPPDSSKTPPYKAKVKSIVLKDISLYQLLKNKTIDIGEILIADGSVQFNRKAKKKTVAENEEKEIDLKRLVVGRVTVKNLYTIIFGDTVIQYAAKINTLMIRQVESPDTANIRDINAYSIKHLEAKISDLRYNVPNGFYRMQVASLTANSNDRKLVLDSIVLSPQYPKYKFSRKAEKQIDRVSAFIKKLEVSDFDYQSLRDSIFLASKIEISSPEVYSFRDKRLPFREKKNKPLPMAALKRFKFGIEVDTILIKGARITYEEFPESGFKSGKVVFSELYATMTNVNNRGYYNKPKQATLEARAKLMGTGTIHAIFDLPLEDDKPYRAKGKISQMALHHLNPALENLAFMSIESGKLNELTFDFDYNDRISNGSLMINYQDLKVKGLKKERSKEKNELKTILINTIVKNDKDHKVPAEKRTGTISFERDRKRQIFNFWWKSLLSGIKGSVLNNNKGSKKKK